MKPIFASLSKPSFSLPPLTSPVRSFSFLSFFLSSLLPLLPSPLHQPSLPIFRLCHLACSTPVSISSVRLLPRPE
ncbi:hypothetical protein P168DRAFT_70396 [Aspergillus campestris IBT 28561]|uniref:Uncharacterized protein n=1 Tax=Aspergillus campestris (strain IBT 28561) TaxID=1392248 RepID=A0A2I1CSL9_ASPC2|nr:uncharacterized protein P168DRAFT_70396 [Aspergillus campestris IBT 28561]PKY00623.1 hypothetical protein P168DRAFT_70396 [Aspergillus campestris IBT 28561]